jgi:nitroreductase
MSGFQDAPEALTPGLAYAPEILMALIKGKRSIRQFTKQEISPEIITQIIEAGRYTPTGLNRQGVSYVVLREHLGECEKIAVSFTRRLRPIIGVFLKPFRRMRIDDHFIFKGAAVAIVVKAKNKTDGLLAASAMELVARAHGLGVLYSGMFTRAAKFSRKLKRQLSAVSRGKAVITLVLGYPAVQYQRTAQREQPLVQYF